MHSGRVAVEFFRTAEQEIEMDAHLKAFAIQWLRVVAMALVPVVLAAFVGIPFALGGHPGEASVRAEHADRHMT